MRNMDFDEIKRRHGVLWRFDTARYTVTFWAEEEDCDPADQFCDERDVEFAREGGSHWFCAFVGVFVRTEDDDGKCLGYDVLGGCSYGSFREFYSSHRWQYSRRQRRWITDSKSRAWKACEARRPRRGNGMRADSSYFTDMVRAAIAGVRAIEVRNTPTPSNGRSVIAPVEFRKPSLRDQRMRVIECCDGREVLA